MVEGCNWVPEYGAWMVEATPNRPYTGFTNDLLRVERNMRLRRRRILTVLNENEIAPTISAFPLIGSQGNDGSVPAVPVGGPRTESEYIGDGIINPHPRFGTLTANVRQRRGSKVNIRVPLFRDVNTPEFVGFQYGPHGDVDGSGSDSQQVSRSGYQHLSAGFKILMPVFQLWRYGKGDASQEKYGSGIVVVGCSKSSRDEETDEANDMVTMKKWLVDVRCEGCKGLFYRSAPGVIVPDADWPRNGDVVVGYEIPNVPGWIRLQNGYYLPMHSDDEKIPFLQKVSTRTQPNNSEMKRIGSGTPLFRAPEQEDLALLLGGKVAISGNTATLEPPPKEPEVASAPNETKGAMETTRAAVHMDAMAFGMGCCCLQITFQAKDIDESRFIYDQLAVMAPM